MDILDLKDVDVKGALKMIASKSGLNIVLITILRDEGMKSEQLAALLEGLKSPYGK